MTRSRGKARTVHGYRSRAVATRDPRERFLIVCEGEQTEPNYFRAFRVPRDVITVRGCGENTVSLVRHAIRLRNEASGAYDQVWCVFDRDSFPLGHFNDALALAFKEKIEVAYSNEAFELWYLLHFDYYHTGLTRQDYCIRLHDLLGHRYEKNSDVIYEELLERQRIAVRNAQKLLSSYQPHRPAHDNPVTTVHKLVEQLNRWCH